MESSPRGQRFQKTSVFAGQVPRVVADLGLLPPLSWLSWPGHPPRTELANTFVFLVFLVGFVPPLASSFVTFRIIAWHIEH